jgi:hypothetical protein
VTLTPIEQSYYKFNLCVDTFTIRGELDDGIFEPGERVVIENIQVTNNGGLTLPAGSLLWFPNTSTFQSEKAIFSLPAISPNCTHVVPQAFYGNIPDIPEAQVIGRYQSQTTVLSHSELMYRKFNNAAIESTILVQYPVQINIEGPEHLVQGEKAIFRINIQNISRIPYGGTTGYNVSWRLNVDPRLHVTGTDAQVIEGFVDYIAPNTTFVHEFEATVNPNASMFELLPWAVDLFFKNKKVEIVQKSVRVTMSFQAMHDQNRDQFDVLFVTNKHIAQTESRLYMRIFDGLGLGVNFWDCEQYNGLSIDNTTNQRHPVSWIGQFQGKLIVFPLGHSSEFPLAFPHDLLSHFIGKISDPVDFDNGLLTIGAATPHVLPYLLGSISGAPVESEHLSGSFVLGVPSIEGFQKKCQDYVLKKAKSKTTAIYGLDKVAYNVRDVPAKNAFWKAISSTYQLGTAEFKELPANCLTRLYNLSKQDSSPLYLSEDRYVSALETTQFPLASRFAITLFSVIRSLSIATKLKLAYSGGSLAAEEAWTFIGKQGQVYTVSDLVCFALYCDISQELLHGIKDGANTRVNRLIYEFNRKPDYFSNIQLLKLITELQIRLKTVGSSIMVFSKTTQSNKNCSKKLEELKQQMIKKLGQPQYNQVLAQVEQTSTQEFTELNVIERPLIQQHQQYIETPGSAIQEVWKAITI